MNSAPSSPISGVKTPCFNLNSPAPSQSCSDPSQSLVTQHPRPPKRTLTAPPTLQSIPLDRSINKRARVSRDNTDIHISDVETLIPKISMMGVDTPLFTPQSNSSNPPSVPFVFNDGFFMFCTPTPYSSGSATSSNSPLSSVSDESFLGVLPDSPRFNRPAIEPLFKRLAIWNDTGEDAKHVYAQTMLDEDPKHISETVSLEYLDPSSTRYGPVQTAATQLACPFIHLGISLDFPSSPAQEKVSINNFSVVEICAPRKASTRLRTEVYNEGMLTLSCEDNMTACDTLPFGGVRYACPLPNRLVDELCTEANKAEDQDTNARGSIVILRFIQKVYIVEKLCTEVVLVIVCDFQAQTNPSPGQIKVAHILPVFPTSKTLFSASSLSTPSVSEGKDNPQNSEKSHCRPRTVKRRIAPSLSVSIPPQNLSLHPTKGHIILTTESPCSNPSYRPPPHTGIPHSAFPVTPSEQVAHTPVDPPELPRSTARSSSSTKYTLTPAESAYPFIQSASSGRSSRSFAFNLFEDSGPGESAPAWPVPQHESPFLPSFFLRRSHMTLDSDAMTSLTRQALDAGTPTLPSFKEGYLDRPLDSPLIISPSATSLPAAFNRSTTPQ